MIKKNIEQIAGELVDNYSEKELMALFILIDSLIGSCGFSIDVTASLKHSYVEEFGKREFNELTKEAEVMDYIKAIEIARGE